jgi:hypothetical protein
MPQKESKSLFSLVSVFIELEWLYSKPKVMNHKAKTDRYQNAEVTPLQKQFLYCLQEIPYH